jgi:hypothetical protein
MKIETRTLNGASPARRIDRRDRRPDDAFKLDESSASQQPARMTGLGGASAVGAVLLAQEEDSPERRQRQSVRRADDLLDRLEEIRLSLLNGRIALPKLEALRDALAARQGSVSNPRLQDTLDAIDLRVAVELAKYHN